MLGQEEDRDGRRGEVVERMALLPQKRMEEGRKELKGMRNLVD